MNNNYEAAAIAIKQAERALETLKEFSETQYRSKGKTMLEQISDYIANVLSDANYMCCGCKISHLALSNMNGKFVFYIYDNLCFGCGYPVFSITTYGEVKHIRELEEWMMLTLVKEWDNFKKELNAIIKITMNERTKRINSQMSHIGYVNEQLAKWHV